MDRSSLDIWPAARLRKCRNRCWPISLAAEPNRRRMRVVGGRHRGRRLIAPPGDTVRPTSDRAREAMFNILSHGEFAAAGLPFADENVLDAFAGTGALGLEALSRGAAAAAFIETDQGGRRARRAPPARAA